MSERASDPSAQRERASDPSPQRERSVGTARAREPTFDPIANLERGMRCLMTRRLDADVRAVRAAGVRVAVLTPGPEDLTAMGGNLMNPRRRGRVLDVSPSSSAAALEMAADEGSRAA